jgi:phosphoglycolate phosphatase
MLGVATGKSNRGLRALIDGYALNNRFVTMQTADNHPSKPHPSMLLATMAETGVAPQDAVMVGDTSYDIEMAQAAGMRSVGVSWGYHSRDAMGRANAFIDDFRELPAVLDGFWGQR